MIDPYKPGVFELRATFRVDGKDAIDAHKHLNMVLHELVANDNRIKDAHPATIIVKGEAATQEMLDELYGDDEE